MSESLPSQSENKPIEQLIEELEIRAGMLSVSLEYHRGVLEEMSTKLDNKIFEQMVKRNGLE